MKELGLFSSQKRRLQVDLIATFQYLKETYREAGKALFRRVYGDRMRGNDLKLRQPSFRLDLRKKFFTIRVLKYWSR